MYSTEVCSYIETWKHGCFQHNLYLFQSLINCVIIKKTNIHQLAAHKVLYNCCFQFICFLFLPYIFNQCNGEHFLYVFTHAKEISQYSLSVICFSNFKHNSYFLRQHWTRVYSKVTVKITSPQMFPMVTGDYSIPVQYALNYSSHKHCKGHSEYKKAW